MSDTLVIIPTYNEKENAEAIARAAELVPPTLDVRLSCLGVGDLRVHVRTPAYKRLTLVVPEDPEDHVTEMARNNPEM